MKKKYQISFALITSILIFFPVLLLLLTSFASEWTYPELLPRSVDVRAWVVLGSESKLYSAIGTSLWIGIVTVISNVFIAFPAAKVMAFSTFKGKNIVEGLLLMPILVPSLAVAMGLHLSLIRVGLAGQWQGVVLVHLVPTVPYSIKILRASLERIGPYFELQAISLGATRRSVLFSIYLPQLLSSIRSVIFLVFVISLSQYALTVLIGGGNVVTLAMIYFPYLSSVNNAIIASFSLLFAVIPIILLLAVEIIIKIFLPYRNK